jgi:hypothetical protein
VLEFLRRLKNNNNGLLEITEKGGIDYLVLSQNNEILFALIKPPESYDGKTAFGGKINVFNPSGEMDYEKSKTISYGQPIILFHQNNKAGLKITNLDNLNEVLSLDENELRNLNLPEIKKENIFAIEDKERVGIGSSIIQFNNGNISIILSPRLHPTDRIILEKILRLTLNSLTGINQKNYRANIMLLDLSDNLLKIAVKYNMAGHRDQNITIKPNTGGIGEALMNDRVARVDLLLNRHSYYQLDENQIWEEMKSLYSIPIHDKKGYLLGVLNIDSKLDIRETKFYNNPEFDQCVELAADILGEILDQKS